MRRSFNKSDGLRQSRSLSKDNKEKFEEMRRSFKRSSDSTPRRLSSVGDIKNQTITEEENMTGGNNSKLHSRIMSMLNTRNAQFNEPFQADKPDFMGELRMPF